MQRDQRLHDNWALLRAKELALESGSPLGIVFNLVPQFLNAPWRAYQFMLEGLKEVEAAARAHGIAFFLTLGDPAEEIPALAKRLKVGAVVTDFNPLRMPLQWKSAVTKHLDVLFEEVDAHNIVPCWIASPKLEFAAYTLRPKLHRLLPEWLTEFPRLKTHPHAWPHEPKAVDWETAIQSLSIDHSVKPVEWIKPGEHAAQLTLKDFLKHRLARYDEGRNDPTEAAQSDLSPYLHYGQLAPQRVALLTQDHPAFFEELVVRRELSDNFCYYNPHYDRFEGFHEWAQKTLNEHRSDPRTHLYCLKEFEEARTHDALWNAAQRQMVETGKMHGYLRMVWAKKILEWTASPEEALRIAIHLNDKYELDGRDPNGYVGVAWSIGGVHDRAWNEREIFGKIRFMSTEACKRKFDVEAYIEAHGDQARLM